MKEGCNSYHELNLGATRQQCLKEALLERQGVPFGIVAVADEDDVALVSSSVRGETPRFAGRVNLVTLKEVVDVAFDEADLGGFMKTLAQVPGN